MEKAGLYYHIPFCRSKCPYCDFYSVRYDGKAAEEYITLLKEESKKYNGVFDTVYLGGGTPSCLEPRLIAELINSAKAHFDIDENAEITVECNPSKELSRDFEVYAQAGVNRISLGMQSARKEERLALGRTAGKAELTAAVAAAKASGINNISLDLMLGTPRQNLSSLEESFEFIDKMQVTHISAYMLKIENGTKFYEMRDRLALPDEDSVCEMYLRTVSALKALGFEQYEISNFAKKGFESRHNLKYWTLADYLGIGKSAHSLWQGRRFYYDCNMNKTDDGEGAAEKERIMLGLRLNRGIPTSLIKKDAAPYIAAGLMCSHGGRISLTPKGMLVSNTIISELI